MMGKGKIEIKPIKCMYETRYCTKHNQLLTDETCKDCDDYIENINFDNLPHHEMAEGKPVPKEE